MVFTDCPVETSLRESDVLREVIAIESEGSLQSKGITSAKASKGDIGDSSHLPNELGGGPDGHADLKAIFAGIAAARHDDPTNAAEGGVHAGHELEVADAGGVLGGHEGGNGALGLGPLDGHESVGVVKRLELKAGELDQVCCKVLHVLVVAGAVDDKVEVILEAADDGIVDGATARIGDDRVLQRAVGSLLDVDDSHLLDEFLTVGPVDAHLTHVGNVEDGGTLAAHFDLLLDTKAVVKNGHLPPEKVDELGPALLVEFVERSATKRAAAVRRSAGCGKH